MTTSPHTETVVTNPKRIRGKPLKELTEKQKKYLQGLEHGLEPQKAYKLAGFHGQSERSRLGTEERIRKTYGPCRVDMLRLGRRAAKKILSEVVSDDPLVNCNANRAVAARLVTEQWARVDPAISRSEVSGTIQHEIVSPALAESLQRAYERYLPSLLDEPIEGHSEPVISPEDTNLLDSPTHNGSEDSASESDVIDTDMLTPEDSR
jgi:hypothetical protein